MLVHADDAPIDEERERDAGGGELRQRDAEEDHPSEEEVDADQRTDRADEQAPEERVAEEEVRTEDLDERAHAPPTASISSVAPFRATPFSTHMTERTRLRTRRT
jgi:hypothetical protein